MEIKENLGRVHYNYGLKTDIAISFEEYLEITDCLLD